MAFTGAKTVIGIDIGFSSIKAVLLSRKDQAVSCLGFQIFDFLPGEPPTKEAIIQGLTEIAKAFRKWTRDAALVSVDRNIQLKFFDKPPMPRDALSMVIANEMKMGSSASEQSEPSAFEFTILGETKGENVTNLNLLCAHVPISFLKVQAALFKSAGLNLIGLYPFPIAIREVYLANYGDRIPEGDSPFLTALINFRATSNQIAVLDKHNLRLARAFPSAGEEITQSLVKTYKSQGQEINLDRASAENYKTTIGILSPEERQSYPPYSLEVQVSDIIQRGVARMTQKLRLSLDYFKGQMKTQVSQAFIFGGMANMHGMLESLGEMLMVPEVHELSPFVKIAFVPESVEQQDPPPELRNKIVLAVGGALCAMKRDETVLNLVPLIKSEFWKNFKKLTANILAPLLLLLVAAALPVIYAYIFFFPPQEELEKLKKEHVTLSEEYAKVSSFKAKYDELIKKKNDLQIRSLFINDFLKKRIFWSQLLFELAQILPHDIWVIEISTAEFMEGEGATGGSGGGLGMGGSGEAPTTAGGGPGMPGMGGPGGDQGPAPNPKIQIKGKSLSYDSISKFLQDLETNKFFLKVKWEESKRESSSNEEISFSVTCDIAQGSMGK